MLSKINILSNGLFRRLVLALALVVCTAAVSAQQKSSLPREHINAFWLMNLTKYVEWPNDTLEDFTVGVFGYSTPEYHRLKAMQANGTQINGRKLKTLKFPNVAKIEYSHILFVNKVDSQYLHEINEKIKGQRTLLVTDSCSANQSDLFMINLVLQSRSNQFQVNLNKANEAGLIISERAVVEGGSRVDVEKINQQMEDALIQKEKELQDKEWELDQKKEEIYQMSMNNDFQEEENSRKEQQIEELKDEIAIQERIADSLMRAAEKLQTKLARDKASLDKQLAEREQKEQLHQQSLTELNDVQDKVRQREISIEDQKKILENRREQSKKNQKEINLITIGIAIFLVLAIIAFINNSVNKKRNRELIAVNDRIDTQKEHIRSQSEQLKLINKELEKLSIVASQTDNGVVIMDNVGNVEWVNHGFEHLTKMSLDDLKHNGTTTFTSLYSSNSQIEEIKDKCLSNCEPVIFECPFHTADGNDIWLQTTLTPIVNENNQITRLVTIDTDISKIKEQEQSILAQGKTLSRQRDELAQQKEFISEQLDNINTSIKYAKTIQDTVMPLDVNLSKYFKYFGIFLPLQTISGDFYWFTRVPDNDHLTFTAAVDCTGHGVPGAFMSVIGARLLSEIIVEHHIYDPKDILTQLNLNLVKALKQDVGDETSEINNDSMEICLCCFDRKSETDYELTFSGARRPLYVYRHDTQEFITLHGDKKTIGGMKSKRNTGTDFTDQTLMLKTDDIVYHTTDGFVDQYDAEMKKYGSERFTTLLKTHAHRDLAIQKELILSEFERQIQNSSQTDDITVFAVKLI
ncbi:MAG: DUF4154 domain-containing protein [Bacteroidales bacterium]|nr:DUF4154 domain-containing protein [Bacteroidales bacterium]